MERSNGYADEVYRRSTSSMKALVVYYSRTETTRKVAEDISRRLNCDIEEIVDTRDRRGVLGFLSSGKEASQKKLATIKEGRLDPASFDVAVLGTPVWSGTMSSPTRAYISKHREEFSKVAFFCTSGGPSGEKVLEAIKDLCGKEPIATLQTTKRKMKSEEYSQDVEQFAKKIAQSIE